MGQNTGSGSKFNVFGSTTLVPVQDRKGKKKMKNVKKEKRGENIKCNKRILAVYFMTYGTRTPTVEL